MTITDEAQEAEAKQVINSVYEIRVQQEAIKATTMAKASHALAMMYFVLKDTVKVSSSSVKRLQNSKSQ